MRIGQRIKARRLELGLSQQELAGDRLSKAYVSQVERGRMRPSPETLAYLAERLGKPVEFFREEPSDQEGRLVELLNRNARRLIASGEHEDALANLEQALRLATEHGIHNEEGLTRESLGELYMAKRDYARALQELEEALDRLRQARNQDALVSVYKMVGDCHFRLGSLTLARRTYERALGLLTGPDKRLRGRILHNLATTLHRLGDYPGADEMLTHACRCAEEAQDLANLARCKLTQAENQRKVGRASGAEELVRTALDLYRRLDSEEGEMAAVHALGTLQSELGRPEEAQENLARACEYYRQHGKWQGFAQASEDLARLGMRQRNLDAAREVVAEALESLTKQPDAVIHGRLLRTAAEIAAAQGRRGEAIELLEQASRSLSAVSAADELWQTLNVLLTLIRDPDNG